MYFSEFLLHPSLTLKQNTETYSEAYQTSKMELLVKIVNDRKPLTIFAKSSILDV